MNKQKLLALLSGLLIGLLIAWTLQVCVSCVQPVGAHSDSTQDATCMGSPVAWDNGTEIGNETQDATCL